MKIQINNLEALERLIGGDSTLEFEVRNSIVQDFTRKHLKAIATDPAFKKFSEAVSREISDKFVQEVGERWSPKKIQLNAEGKKLVEEHLKTTFENLVSEKITKLVNDSEIMKSVNQKMVLAAQYIEASLTDKALEARLDKMVEERIRQRLNIR